MCVILIKAFQIKCLQMSMCRRPKIPEMWQQPKLKQAVPQLLEIYREEKKKFSSCPHFIHTYLINFKCVLSHLSSIKPSSCCIVQCWVIQATNSINCFCRIESLAHRTQMLFSVNLWLGSARLCIVDVT